MGNRLNIGGLKQFAKSLSDGATNLIQPVEKVTNRIGGDDNIAQRVSHDLRQVELVRKKSVNGDSSTETAHGGSHERR